jgi:Xaa-Pro aminopeptidase
MSFQLLPPLPASEHEARRARLMREIGPGGVAIIPAASEVTRSRDTHFPFRQDSDFAYLTGFPEPDAIAVLAPGRDEGEYILFTRPRDAEREIWDGRRHGPEGACEHFGADQAYTIDEFEETLPGLLAGRRTVHFNLGDDSGFDAIVTGCVRTLRELSRRGAPAPEGFAALDASLHEQRLIKSEAELARMRLAGRVSALAHIEAMRLAAPGIFEWQLAARIHSVFAEHDMQPGYGSIVGRGDNACILHYVENRDALRAGDLVLIDAGGEYQGYTADITRTFPADGRYRPEQKAVYDIVLAAQLAAIDAMRAGVASDQPHLVATRVLTQGMVDLGWLEGEVDGLIERGAQRRFYMHGTGHWLGMDVHDVGRYRVNDQARPFAPGMVMTVEPGLYVAPGSEGVDGRWHGIGIRIEDDVAIRDGEPEILTAEVPKSTHAIEALMAEAAG